MTSLQNDPQGPPLTRRELRERERAAQAANAGGVAEVGDGHLEDEKPSSAPAEAPVEAETVDVEAQPEAESDGTTSDAESDRTTSDVESDRQSFDNVLASEPPAEQSPPNFAPSSFAPPAAEVETPAEVSLGDSGSGRPLTRRELRAQQHGAEGAEPGDTQVVDPVVADGPISAASTAPEAVSQAVPAPTEQSRAATEVPQASETPEPPRTFQPPTGHWSIAADEPEGDDPNASLAARSVVSTGSVTTANALILPSVPSLADATGPLTATGELLVTGSIDLPRSLGATGQHPQAGFDSADIDHMFEQAASENASTDATPIRAANAVSTHTSSRNVITPPKNRGTRLPTILAITAAVLALGVVGLLVAGYVFKVF
jgi:hypothetical protein